MRVTLLGPQRRPRVDSVVRSLGLTGPFATVTAGWQEREPDDALLDELLSGRSVNLLLHRRMGEVAQQDPEFAVALRDRDAALAELAQLYLIRLDLAVQAVHALSRSGADAGRLADAVAAAEQTVRDLDAEHLANVAGMHAEFYTAYPPHERPAIAAHRAEIALLLQGCEALVVAGGHVGELLEVLHLFNIAAALELPVIAWSAGAMALTERVVLFHDRSDHGPAAAEVHDAGLGLVKGVVALPSAHRRLRMDDAAGMGLLARRFTPASCLVLEAGDRVELAADGTLPGGAAVLGHDGRIGPAAA